MTQLALFQDELPPVGWLFIDNQGFTWRTDAHKPLRSDPDTIGAQCTILQINAVYTLSPAEYRRKLTHPRYPKPFLPKP